MMSMYAIDRGRMAIFIDALDECERDAREKIMDALALIVERSGGALVKLFISSRDDVSLEMLPKHKHFEILVEENRNQQDINGYVKAQLSQLIKKDKLRILGSKGVPKGLQAKLVDRLSQGAQGMYVDFQILSYPESPSQYTQLRRRMVYRYILPAQNFADS